MLSVIQTLYVIIKTKCSLVSAKIAKSSFETYLLSMLGCLHGTMDFCNFQYKQKFKSLGT